MGVPQLADLVLETANAPGTGIITLGGAPEGRQTFADAFPAGGEVFYYASDGAQTEWGIGTLTVGSPNTLVRTKVLGNLFGTDNALNFTSGITVWCEVPAQCAPSLDDTGLLPVSGSPDYDRDVALSAKAAEARYVAQGSKDPQSITGDIIAEGNVIKDAPTGSRAQFTASAGGKARWTFGRDGAPETGSNTGSNFAVSRFDDDGTLIDTPLGIQRDTGVVELLKGISVSGAADVPDTSKFDGTNAVNAQTAEKRYIKSVPVTGQTRITDLVKNADGRSVFSDGTNATALANLTDVTTAGIITGGTYTKTPLNDGSGKSVLEQTFTVSSYDGATISFPITYDSAPTVNITAEDASNGLSVITNARRGKTTTSGFVLHSSWIQGGTEGSQSDKTAYSITAKGLVS